MFTQSKEIRIGAGGFRDEAGGSIRVGEQKKTIIGGCGIVVKQNFHSFIFEFFS